jgi:SPOR domain
VAAGGGRFVFDKRVGGFPSRGHIITMANRYQDRAYPAGGDYDRDGRAQSSANVESDPLAELARLIGQNDPFSSRPMSRANLPFQQQPRPADPEPAYDDYADEPEPDESPAPAPPSWMQRAVRQEAPPPPPEDEYPSAVHPLHRYAAAQSPAEPEDYDPAQLFADTPQEPDLSRYDETLYGSFDSGAQNVQHDQAYVDDGYAYEEDQHFEAPEEPRRRGGMITVAAVLALAVFGVGGAFAYRTYTGSARSGEPPIIRADAGPTKIIPAPADGGTKLPDRMATGDGTEKIVSREETPIDPAARSGPRVVFPALTQNGSMPMPTSVVPPSAPPPAANAPNGTFSNNEPHRVKTLPVRGDQGDGGTPAGAAPPAAAPPKPAPRSATTPTPRTQVAADNASAPLSLSPQQAAAQAPPEPPVRMAATNPVQIAPGAPAATSGTGGASGSFLVQVSSQRSEADAQASFRALQGKFPSVLGSRAPVIKRADLGEKGTYYRAMVGPFNSPDEASQFCGSLKSAGGQCVVQRN